MSGSEGHRRRRLPYDCVVAVTYRCNSRCLMCNIWNQESGEDLDVSLLARLPATLKYVNVSGGEPFLRKDLPEVIGAIRRACPGAQIIISSNGLVKRTREVAAALRRLDPGLAIAISIDGIGENHDRIRGVPGAFDRAMRLVEGLRRDGMSNLRLAFTVYDENVRDFQEVYRLSRRLGVEFTSAVAQGSSHYFRSPGLKAVDADQLRQQFDRVASAELRSRSPKRWARAYFDRGLYQFAHNGGRPLACHAADDFFFLSPAGTVYACNILDLPLGNLHQSTFEEIWNSPAAAEARARVADCQMGCWMVCTARSAIKRNPLKVAGWVTSGKIRATLGKPVI